MIPFAPSGPFLCVLTQQIEMPNGTVVVAEPRGGFVVDLHWKNGKPTEVKIRSINGRTTTVAFGTSTQTVRLTPGASVTLRDFAR